MAKKPLQSAPAAQDARLAACAVDVRTNPDSSEALSVFADVLIEQGDPHGELIMLEGQLEQQSGYLDPDSVRKLIQQKTEALLLPITQKYPFINPIKTKGGLITDAELSDTKLTLEALKELMTAENFQLLTALTTRLGASTTPFFTEVDPELLNQLRTLTLSCSNFNSSLATALAARNFPCLQELKIFADCSTEDIFTPTYYPPRAVTRAVAILRDAPLFDHLEVLTVSGLYLPFDNDDVIDEEEDDYNCFRTLLGSPSTTDKSLTSLSFKKLKHLTFHNSGGILAQDLESFIQNASHLETLNLWEEDILYHDKLTIKKLGKKHSIKVSIKAPKDHFY